jgi:protocatechuate 3,4-dioxygenase beta subunit
MVSRREFCLLALAVPAALVRPNRSISAQGLGQFVAPSVPCGDLKPTPAVADDSTFKPGAPQRSSLIVPGVSGQKLTLTGAVAGVVCGPITGARVDFWQADSRGRYDMSGFRLRGYVLTDASGVYRIQTVVPGRPAGRARHINIKVQSPGKPTLTTQVFTPDDPMNKKDAFFKPELALKMSTTPGGLSATFNLILDA